MLLRHAIGAALRRIRLGRGLTLRDLSQQSRISIPYLSEIERGRKEPSSEILATICRVFGMTLVDLVDAVSDEARLSEPLVLTTESLILLPGDVGGHDFEVRAPALLVA